MDNKGFSFIAFSVDSLIASDNYIIVITYFQYRFGSSSRLVLILHAFPVDIIKYDPPYDFDGKGDSRLLTRFLFTYMLISFRQISTDCCLLL